MIDESRVAAHQAFRRAVGLAGSQANFERRTGAKQQKVSYWFRKGMVLPGEYVLATEAAFGVSRHELRPDLYPPSVAPRHPSPPAERTAGGSPVAESSLLPGNGSCDRRPVSQLGEAVR